MHDYEYTIEPNPCDRCASAWAHITTACNCSCHYQKEEHTDHERELLDNLLDGRFTQRQQTLMESLPWYGDFVKTLQEVYDDGVY